MRGLENSESIIYFELQTLNSRKENMLPKTQNILYETDLSESSAYAYKYALNSAVQHNAKIHMLHVIEPLSPREKAELSNYI